MLVDLIKSIKADAGIVFSALKSCNKGFCRRLGGAHSHGRDSGIHYVNTSFNCLEDGHGSDTYVRSDVGARLAGEIALEAVKRFILPLGDIRPDSDWIAGMQGAVTARENDVLTRYSEALPRAEEDMTDTDWMRYRQRLEFRGQVKGIYEQDAIFQALFSSIYEKWLEAIHQDARENPFTEEELARLGKHKLVKAYGTTLMTYVQAKDFWFAFHIGDGRMLSYEEGQGWKQIVPWDCNCFQNQTTSLCNTDPIPMFRYAFGTKSEKSILLSYY